MIESIYIVDFQKHESLSIALDERITTIVGPSDVGKSAIVRALRWLCRNQPQGDEFIRDGQKSTLVEAGIDDQTVVRERGRNSNAYHLNGRSLVSFGSGVPDPVQSVLRTADINFQSQHDAAFWFSLSAGEVSRQLNAIVDLGVIDEALADVAKRVRYHRQEYQICKERLKEAKWQREAISWVTKADRQYQRVERLRERERKMASLTSILNERVSNVESLTDRQQTANTKLTEASSVIRRGRHAKGLGEQVRDLHRIVGQVREYRKTLDEDVPDFSEAKRIIGLWDQVCDVERTLSRIVEQIEAGQEKMKKKQTEYRKAVYELEKRTGGVCPVCGGELVGSVRDVEMG